MKPAAEVPFRFDVPPEHIDPGLAVTGVGAAGEVKVNVPTLVPVPDGVITATVPVAEEPVMAVMDVELFTINDAALTPPNVTAVAPVKFAPVIETDVPLHPVDGLKEVTVGAGLEQEPV